MIEQTEMPAHYQDLGAVQQTWRVMMQAAIAERAHPFKKPVLTTVGLSGAPKARIIILRDLDFETHTIRLHTDARSEKVAEIYEKPEVMLAFYDPSQEIQMQMSGKALVHLDDDYAEAAWNAAPASSRRAYLADAQPGSTSPEPISGLPRDVEGKIPSEERLAEGRKNFAAVQVIVDRIDWLYLSPKGNRRARFTREGEEWTGVWLAP